MSALHAATHTQIVRFLNDRKNRELWVEGEYKKKRE